MKRIRFLLLSSLLFFGLLLSFCGCIKTNTDSVSADGLAPTDVITGYPVIFRQVYCTGSNRDTPVRYSFVELYNTSDRSVSLRGYSLQYASGDRDAYVSYPFADDAAIPPHTSFLIRCAAAKGEDGEEYLDACEKFTLTNFDANFPMLVLSSKRTRLLLASTQKGLKGDVFASGQVRAYFGACADGETLPAPVNSFSLHKTTAIRRSDDLSRWECVDYSAQSCLSVTQYTPCGTKGANTDIPLSGVDVVFSMPGGRYNKPFDVSLSTLPGYEILYTFDCSIGVRSFQSYRKPLSLKTTDANGDYGKTTALLMEKYGTSVKPRSTSHLPGAAVLRACVTDGKDYGPVITQTYYVMDDIDDYDGILFWNITVKPEDFTGKNGIYAKISDDIFAKRGKIDGYMELCETDGSVPDARYVQLVMNGNGSLGFCQKSMRVYLREKTTAENGGTMAYDIFQGYARNASGVPIESYKTLLLRNSGNDASCAHFRDALMQRISADVNACIQAYRPVYLFINGEFWGLYNIRERYDASYFHTHYGVEPENLVMLESISPLLTGSWNTKYALNEGEPGDEEDFYALVDYVAEHDMKEPEAFAWVEEHMDLDNFADFFLASCYLANTDWPGNNIKVWRNKNPDDPSGLDTRWRWVLSDMDFGVGHSTSASQPMFDHALTEDTVCGKLMVRLLKNPEYRMRFAERGIELCNTIYDSLLTVAEAEHMADAIAPYIENNFQRWRGDGGSMERWEDHVSGIYSFLKARSSLFCGQLDRACRISIEPIRIDCGGHASASLGRYESGPGCKLMNLYERDGKTLTVHITPDDGYRVVGMTVKIGPKNQTVDGDTFTFDVFARTEITVQTEPAA